MATIQLTKEELERYVGLEVLKIVGPERQRELLIAAIEEVAKSYSCKVAVETVVKAAVEDAARELLKEPGMEAHIARLARKQIDEVFGK